MRTLIFLFTVSILFSCNGPETVIDPDAIFCSNEDCSNADCAESISPGDTRHCTLKNDNDVDWYSLYLTEEDVNNNFGLYSVNLSNLATKGTLVLDLFKAEDLNNSIYSLQALPESFPGDILTFEEAGEYIVKIYKSDNKGKELGYNFDIGI